ncbi:UDP-N-acetylmuramoyl-tripeptide--D-alanyl-D-alanine ligase [Halomonas sp. AOP25-F1-15]|uniref:UDP-N-acetylmuramoyl-tripeptide--D-alanyl-D- alanine ligase n=1 Tax=Halomonas sp. AOP25-F1-15 TaxID=3457709 RepID=UPI0040334DA2
MQTRELLKSCSSVIGASASDVQFCGVDYRLSRLSPGMFFIIMDDSWPLKSKKRYRQYGKSATELIGEARKIGVSKFVINSDAFVVSDFVDSEFIKVTDTNRFFYEIASACNEISLTTKIAITGSAGKSTTKDMVSLLLDDEGKSEQLFVARPSENIRPTILSQLTQLNGYDYAVLEVAGSCFIYFERERFSLAPEVAIITSISEGHLDYLGTLKGVAEHKAKIFSGMSKSGFAVINLDTPFSDLLVEKATQAGASVVGYGSSEVADVQLIDYEYSSGLVTAKFFDETISYKLGARGKHMALNSIAAVVAIKLSGCKGWKSRINYLEKFFALSGRGEISKITIKDKKITVIDEAYNANPVSMESALQMLSEISPDEEGRRIVVLGDMMELGGEAESLHAKLLDSVLSSKADKVYLVGDYMQHLWVKLPKNIKGALFPTIEGFYRFLRPSLKDGDVVLFKSSNSTRLNVVVKKLKQAGL